MRFDHSRHIRTGDTLSLKTNKDKIFVQDTDVMQKLVSICCNLKASVVFQDEKEKNLRQILNFGHTYAHALEKLTDYKVYTHGEAVSLGMEFIFKKALNENKISKEYCEFAIDLLNDFGLLQIGKTDNLTDKDKLTDTDILSAMKFDKKVKDGKIIFVMPKDYAQVEIV